MDKLMNAASAVDVTPTVPGTTESKVNLSRFCRIIAQVYSYTCEDFGRVKGNESETNALIAKYLDDEKFVRAINRKGLDESIITTKTALQWTADYINEKTDKIQLVVAVTPEVAEREMKSNPDYTSLETWTAAIISDDDVHLGDYITIRSMNKKMEYVVLNESVNFYSVTLR